MSELDLQEDCPMQDTSEEIYSAIRTGKLSQVKELINKYGLENGYFALRIAVEKNFTEITKLLLDSGSNFNREQNIERTPLHFAIKNNNMEVVKLLLNRGADTEVLDRSGKTPLDLAIEMGLLVMTQYLLEAGANVNHTHLSYGFNKYILPMPNNYLDKKDLTDITTIHMATWIGHVQIVELLLKHGADVNAKNKKGYTPLHFATISNDFKMVKFLLNNFVTFKDAKVSLPKRVEGFTPLHFAAQFGNEKIVKVLLDNNADINSLTNNNYTPLHIALQNSNDAVSYILLRHKANININIKDYKYRTVLHMAVEDGDPKMVKEILKLGPDINDNIYKHSLKFAAYQTKKVFKEIIEDLLAYGFTLEPEDFQKKIFLYNAIHIGSLKLVEYLLGHGIELSHDENGCSPLLMALKNNDEKIAAVLIEKGSDVNVKDKQGWTPLFRAVKKSKYVLAELLLAHGANLQQQPDLLRIATMNMSKKTIEVLLKYKVNTEVVDDDGRTALHLIAMNDFEEWDSFLLRRAKIAELLLRNGANVNAKTESGYTPLHLACRNNNAELVEVLLKFEPDLECFSRGLTPLHEAVGNESMVRMLISSGANVNTKNTRTGSTAFHFAVKRGHIKVMNLLLKENANVNSRDNEGRTPLHWAAFHDAPEAVDFLLNYGLQVDDVDNNGYTALHFAVQQDSSVATEILLECGADVNIMTKDKYLARRLAGCEPFSIEEDEYFDEDCLSTSQAMQQRLIMLSSGGLYLAEENKRFVSSKHFEMDYFRQGCEHEIKTMKNEFVGNTQVNFYNLLNEPISVLAKYAKKEEIFKVLLKDIPYKFRIYSKDLNRKFKRVVERKLLVDQVETFFEGLLMLPYAFANQLIDYLGNDDLKNVIDAYK